MKPISPGRARLFVVMGVSGCGKSTVARDLSRRTGGVFLDGDDFHPAANVRKMAAGIPLTDEDRWSWLQTLNDTLRQHAADAAPVFLACSALREIYREQLRAGLDALTFIYLKGSRECIARRQGARHGHFMPASLLDSQFATLEEPADAVVVSIEQSEEAVVEDALGRISPDGKMAA